MLLKRKLSKGIKPSYILFVFFLLVSTRALAAPGSRVSSPSFPSISIPSELARIEKTHQGTNGKTIVLIQAAHVDYAAQKSISDVLKHLIERGTLKLVLVEGGWGNVGLSYLRTYADPKGRLEVAEKYLKEGKISGDEYLDIVSDLDMVLWGVEAQELYRKNMEAFIGFEKSRTELLQKIAKLEQALSLLEETIFSEKLREFEGKRKAFQSNELSLSDYLIFLSQKVDSPAFAAFPHLQKLLNVMDSNRNFDSDKVQVEKQKLVQTLSRTLTRLELDELTASLKSQKTPEDEIRFLDRAFSLYEKNRTKLPSLSFDNLKRYYETLGQVTAADPSEMFDELAKLEEIVGKKLLVSKEERKLKDLTRSTELLKKLFGLELSSNEFEKIEKDPHAFAILNEAPIAQVDFEKIKQGIPQAKAFYDSAIKREKALIENSLHKIEGSGEEVVAVLAGGFHSEHLVQAFQERGYSLYVISPRFTLDDSQDHQEKYLQILRYKWEAAANLAPSDFTVATQGGVKANETR